MPKIALEALKFGIQGITLASTSCNIGQLRQDSLPPVAHQTMTLNIEKWQNDHNQRDQWLLATLRIAVKACYEDQEPSSPAFEVNAAFRLHYAVLQPLDRKIPVEESLKPLVILHAWPFWREFVQSMTVRMGLPALTVPVINVQALAEELQTTEKAVMQKAK